MQNGPPISENQLSHDQIFVSRSVAWGRLGIIRHHNCKNPRRMRFLHEFMSASMYVCQSGCVFHSGLARHPLTTPPTFRGSLEWRESGPIPSIRSSSVRKPNALVIRKRLPRRHQPFCCERCDFSHRRCAFTPKRKKIQ